ncbi:MAG: peptidoglycan DD-metalloendopeptidase family protein [Oscillospiraceae bacterium]|nr:peptidoglycan DD-metalloendopeptidase family protein [Oscillospiraceae bacterium]
MKRKKFVSFVAILLILLMVFSLVSMAITSAYAVSQSEIDALKKRRDEITEKREAKQAEIDALKEHQADVLEIKAALDERNNYCIRQILLNNEVVEMYTQMIADKEQEVIQAKKLETQQLDRYRSRVRAMEENGQYDYLELLLQTASLSDFLTLVDDIGEIMEEDRQLEDEYIAAREYTEAVKAEYETYKAETQLILDSLHEESQQLQEEIKETDLQLEQIQAEMDENSDELQALIADQNAADDLIEKRIAELEAQKRKEEERRKQQAAAAQGSGSGGSSGGGGGVTGTGSFMWPCPSCYYITSRVGYRWHPISGIWKYHSGLDIGAQMGASILAADSGTVTIAGVNGGYGNCVMIDHGNGYYTLYGHMSSIAVSVGNYVGKGSTIGYVGSTGWSTGPHLHFEIRLGSTCLDPENWFTKGLSYAADAGD